MRPLFERSNSRTTIRTLQTLLVAILVGGAAGCLLPDWDQPPPENIPDDDEPPVIEPDKPQPIPEEGQTSFYSAAAQNGEETAENNFGGDDSAGAAAPGDRGEADRQIEQGDIYQVVDHSDQILNLNRYRGLQVIDTATPSNPEVIGRVRLNGRPVEMYLVGDKVYALLNGWRAYYASESNDTLLPDRFSGGLVAVVDISDPTDPKVEKRTRVPGRIAASRLTRGRGEEALFVVATDSSGRSGYGDTTYVRSFDVSGRGSLEPASRIDLGGRVTDIAGADNHLMVARRADDSKGSKVSLVDVSDPSGDMVEGDQVGVKGIVENKNNMDLEGDVLRVVSGATWRGPRKNYLETFDASDLQNLQTVDRQSFAPDERLEATLFMENKAFVVTFEQIDPFFAFRIDDDGDLTRKNEYEVSGWNDYFVPVADGDRMVGIGRNDGTMAVTLYDAANLTNPEPMLKRREVPMEWASSEANYDDRAFSVLRRATRVEADDGTVETGMVLLPYSGWDDDGYRSGVQIFTFSSDTLTRRGKMSHGSPVRRSFVSDRSESTTANLSDAELGLYDTTDPNDPDELGRVQLSPSYTDFWTLDDHGVRRRDPRRRYRYGPRRDREATSRLEVVPLEEHPDTAEPLASVEIPANAQVLKHGEFLVVAELEETNSEREDGLYRRDWETDLTVWDFSDPADPTVARSLTTDALGPHRRGDSRRYYGYRGSCLACSTPGRSPGAYRRYRQLAAHSYGDTLVFVDAKRERRQTGRERIETYRPERSYWDACGNHRDRENCSYYNGSVRCVQPVDDDGEPTEGGYCRGEIKHCQFDDEGEDVDCEEVDREEAPTVSETETRDVHETWRHFVFHGLDLSTPAEADVEKIADRPTDERDVSYVADDDTLYVTHREPYDKPKDSRPYVRYYFTPIDLEDPASPEAGPAVNIPGKLLDVKGETLVTRDYLWGDEIVETSIDTATWRGDVAELRGSYRFEDQKVESVALDGAGHPVVVHRLGWRARDAGDTPDQDGTYVSTLDIEHGVEHLDRSKLAGWGSLVTAANQRGIFSVPGGLLLVDLTTPAEPTAQSYYPVDTWNSELKVRDDQVYLSAGSYGVYRFPLDHSNLLSR